MLSTFAKEVIPINIEDEMTQSYLDYAMSVIVGRALPEVRMARIAHEMLADLDKETVDFVPNYDESEFDPSVLPARLPNLLVNGFSSVVIKTA